MQMQADHPPSKSPTTTEVCAGFRCALGRLEPKRRDGGAKVGRRWGEGEVS